jgi:SAM-dependent methyltransferase
MLSEKMQNVTKKGSCENNFDKKNATFWNELCGSQLARSLGINEISAHNLRLFDEAYFSIYPYFKGYFFKELFERKKVLEIGLGYGTLGQALADKNCDYHAIDVAKGPIEMMRYRLSEIGRKWKGKIQIASALNLPYGEATFDYVYSIGCLHHIGDLDRAVSEVYRILRVGGKSVIMLYNRYSFRLLVQVPIMRFMNSVSKKISHRSYDEIIRGLYDTDMDGNVAPHTDFISRKEAFRLFRKFSEVSIEIRNFDNYSFHGKSILKREWFLNNLGRILGLDLYIVAVK